MTVLITLIFLLIAISLLLLKRIKASITTIVLTLIWIFLIGSGALPSLLLYALQAPFTHPITPTWQNKNVIVILGAGTVRFPTTQQIEPSILAYSKMYKAASLYFDCVNARKQCKILITGGDPLHRGISEAEVYKNALSHLNIDISDIQIEPNSPNTYKNAEFTSILLKEQKFDQVFLVTSGFHLKRAMLFFSHFRIHAVPVLADYLSPQFSVIPLGYNFAVADFAIHEFIGMITFAVYDTMGWNKNVPST